LLGLKYRYIDLLVTLKYISSLSAAGKLRQDFKDVYFREKKNQY
jgi:hypothetical protein